MSDVGRNDPCPCGSGKKYKRCCLHRDEAATDTFVAEGAATMAVIQWLGDEHHDRVLKARDALPGRFWEDEENASLALPLLAWEAWSASGERLCLQYPDRLLRRFDPREERWFRAQCESWFSVWDVIEVRRDEGLFLRDVLTGEERFVRERKATHHAVERSTLLARTSRLGDVWTLASAHPAQLPPREADGVVREARRVLKLGRGTVDRERLRGEPAFRLVALWEEALQALLRQPSPGIRNTDGDELVRTEDVFSFQPESRAKILQRLRAMPELEAEDEDPTAADARGLHAFRHVRDVDDAGRILSLARIQLHDRFLFVEANSERRADATSALIEGRLGTWVTFESREESDRGDRALSGPGYAGDDEPELDPDEVNRLILEHKTSHYATWPDTPLPALGGMTPREAAKDKRRKVYRELDLVLREIESGESRLPFEQRYDVGILRRELGIP